MTTAPGTEPSRPVAAPGSPAQPLTAVFTLPNLLSALRILLMPVCAWLLATGRFGIGLPLTAAVALTDGIDGWLARRTNSVSRLGQLMDPLADRLLIGSVAVALLARGALPWLAVALLLFRDLMLLVGFQVLQRLGVRPPDVIWLGKLGTMVLLVALPVLIAGELAWPGADWFQAAGALLLGGGIVLYYVTGLLYLRLGVHGLRARRRPTPPRSPDSR